ncbi:MgtC/SapB family protein [Massilia cavernae]|uniref:Protein MgtC n=1 Tax=Massilia cavernae TaxID=2320864 RepID=A0A418XTA9_9BURK|nr:MgtC/SapB family protein [Massilia cavernae]RJG15872.1 MgtC/SapB family protein [Massilia cavernae]
MPLSWPELFASYWSQPEVAANILILLNMAGALALGLVVGYERSYHGRAAGMRTYGLVCMASAAMMAVAGHPDAWFAGQHAAMYSAVDPTRVIQGIVTGIGFLGAGVIMREGFSISGLTTAASIWASSAIGIMVGLGMYLAAIGLAVLAAGIMVYLSKLESILPSRHAVAITLRFKDGFLPHEEGLRRMALERGYTIAGGSLTIGSEGGAQEWRFVALALSKHSGAPLSELAQELATHESIASFKLAHARN